MALQAVQLPVDFAIMVLSMTGTVSNKGPRRYITPAFGTGKVTQCYGIYLINFPLVKPDESLCRSIIPNTNIRLVQMVAAWGFTALILYFFIAFWFFLSSRGRAKKSIESTIKACQRWLEFLCFRKKSPFSESKDVLKDIAREIGLLFHDFDWAPSDIVLGLILIKREQKRLNEVLQARRILVDREKIRAAAAGRLPFVVSPASGSFFPASPFSAGSPTSPDSISSSTSIPRNVHRFHHYLGQTMHPSPSLQKPSFHHIQTDTSVVPSATDSHQTATPEIAVSPPTMPLPLPSSTHGDDANPPFITVRAALQPTRKSAGLHDRDGGMHSLGRTLLTPVKEVASSRSISAMGSCASQTGSRDGLDKVATGLTREGGKSDESGHMAAEIVPGDKALTSEISSAVAESVMPANAETSIIAGNSECASSDGVEKSGDKETGDVPKDDELRVPTPSPSETAENPTCDDRSNVQDHVAPAISFKDGLSVTDVQISDVSDPENGEPKVLQILNERLGLKMSASPVPSIEEFSDANHHAIGKIEAAGGHQAFKGSVSFKINDSPVSISPLRNISGPREDNPPIHSGGRDSLKASSLPRTPSTPNHGEFLVASSPLSRPRSSVPTPSSRRSFPQYGGRGSIMGLPMLPGSATPSPTMTTGGGRPSWSRTPTSMLTTGSGKSPSKFSPWVSRKARRAHHRSARSFDRLKMTGNVTGSILREDVDDILHYARFAEVVYAPDEVNSLFDVSGRLLRHNPTNQLFLSPYFIVYDPETDAIIIAIRGTFSVADVLVDLKFDLAEFEIPELDGEEGGAKGVHWAHSGMLRTAKNVVEDIEKEDILRSVLTDPSSEYFKCPLVVTGHSLGAGVAALVTSLLRSNYPSACCYAYEPPGCLLSALAAQHFESFCTSVIMGDDIVPRITRNSMEHLKADLSRVIGTCNVPKWRVFQSVLGEKKKRNIQQRKKPGVKKNAMVESPSGKQGDAEKGFGGGGKGAGDDGKAEKDFEKGIPGSKFPNTPKELLDMLMSKKGNSPEEEEMLKRAVEHFIHHDPAFSIERVLQFTPMFVPGRILYIEKHRRPPQTLQQAIGVAFNAAGEKIKDGLRDGAEGIKDVFALGRNETRRQRASMDNLDVIGGTTKVKRGMSISLNDLRPDRTRTAERVTKSSLDIRVSESLDTQAPENTSTSVLPMSGESRAPRKKSRFQAKRHARRMSADDVVSQGKPLWHAKSAPDMMSPEGGGISVMSLNDVSDGEGFRKPRETMRPSVDAAPRKSFTTRSKSRDAIRGNASSMMSLDLDRKNVSRGRLDVIGRADTRSRMNRSVDDILVVGRKNTFPAPSDGGNQERPYRGPTVTFKHGGSTNNLSANAPRLIASAALAPPMSVAINNPTNDYLQKPTSTPTPSPSTPLSSPPIPTPTPITPVTPITPKPSPQTQTSANFSPIPTIPRASITKRMSRQGSTIVPFTIRNTATPQLQPHPTSQNASPLSGTTVHGDSVPPEVRVTIITPDSLASVSTTGPSLFGSPSSAVSGGVELSKPQYPNSAYAVKKCGVPVGGALRRSGKYHYVPRWASKEEFGEIVISRSCMKDHSPFALLRELQEAPAGSILGVAQTNPTEDEEDD
ncbi:hypothetical protein HDU67_006288 [Dinochytrium kinnereticum]|nr:hypothetical protein HDU67_006288 [Dinochytrium kinnereticum]